MKYLFVAWLSMVTVIVQGQQTPKGLVEITDACAGAGLGGNPYRDGTYTYYMHEVKRTNDLKSVGPFIMLSLIVEKNKQSAK